MSKKQITTLLATLAVLGALVGAKLQSQEHRYIVFNGFNATTMKTLDAQGETYHWEGKNLILTTRNPQHLLATLSLIEDSQNKALRVYYQNQANRYTTKGPDGRPYRRLSPAFDQNGLFCGVTVDQDDHFWVSEPDHPDAVLAGPHMGDVAYPNVCAIKETALLTEANDELRKLGTVAWAIAPSPMTPTFMFQLGGADPFVTLNAGLMGFGSNNEKPHGHICSAACLSLPSEFQVLNNAP